MSRFTKLQASNVGGDVLAGQRSLLICPDRAAFWGPKHAFLWPNTRLVDDFCRLGRGTKTFLVDYTAFDPCLDYPRTPTRQHSTPA
jgi:hypothetical protein